jgi:hypothetical protein
MKTISYFITILTIISLGGCSHFEELNKNPNASTDLNPNLQIANIQMRQSESHHIQHRYLTYPGGFMKQWTGDWSITQYGGHAAKNQSQMDEPWGDSETGFYPRIVKEVVDVIERTKGDPNQVNVNSVARILKVENFLRFTDRYGDIPYFNAGMGYYTGDYNVPYDKQEDIYNDFFKELSEASAALTAGGDLLTNDLYYNGDIAKWKRFANSLHLRIAMRLVKVNPDLARQEAEKAIAAGVFASNADICMVKHENYLNPGSGLGPGNGLAIRLSNQGDPTQNQFRLTTEIISAMESRQDPRILYYGGIYRDDSPGTDITSQVLAYFSGQPYSYLTIPGQHFTWDEGMWRPNIDITVNGENVNVAVAYQLLQPNKMIQKYDAPFVHMTYAEVEYLLAEAAFRWNIGTGSAQSHFEKALEASVRQWSVYGVNSFDETAISNYVSFNSAKFAGNELTEINTQLWILHFLDPHETWSNWRRTGIPQMTFVVWPDNASNGQFPRRLIYPIEEQIQNAENYREAVKRMGGTDDWINRVWWDKE